MIKIIFSLNITYDPGDHLYLLVKPGKFMALQAESILLRYTPYEYDCLGY